MNISFKGAKPDARVYILQIIIVSCMSFSLHNWIAVLVLFAAIDLFVLAQIGAWRFFYHIGFYAALLALLYGLTMVSVPILSKIFPPFLMFLIRLYPIYMLGSLLITKAPMNELLFILDRLHIPKAVSIPLAVIYRYIPTILKEITYVHESLKMRGLNSSLRSILRHPVKSAENMLVPLLFRSERISEELSAASLCKGLSTKRRRSCCMEVKFGAVDVLYVIGTVLVAGIVFYLNTRL